MTLTRLDLESCGDPNAAVRRSSAPRLLRMLCFLFEFAAGALVDLNLLRSALVEPPPLGRSPSALPQSTDQD